MNYRRSAIANEAHQAAEMAARYLSRAEAPPLFVILILFGAQVLLRRRHPRTAHIGLSIVPVEKRRSPMDPIQVDGSHQDVLCQCSPTADNGSPTSPTITWLSSDETVIRLEVSEDTRTARGVTLRDGTAVITANTGALAEGTPVLSESGTVVVSGIGAPPVTTSLGLAIAPVEKLPPA